MHIEIEDMTEDQAKKTLTKTVDWLDWLDELDGEDYFGTEGWKHQSGMEN